MLNFSQKAVLKVIDDHCTNRDSCLLLPSAIVAFANSKRVSEENVYEILKSLEQGGYIDLILTSGKDGDMYCITLTSKGRNFKEEYKKSLNAIKFRLLLALLSACVSFIVGKILVILFA